MESSDFSDEGLVFFFNGDVIAQGEEKPSQGEMNTIEKDNEVPSALKAHLAHLQEEEQARTSDIL